MGGHRKEVSNLTQLSLLSWTMSVSVISGFFYFLAGLGFKSHRQQKPLFFFLSNLHILP